MSPQSQRDFPIRPQGSAGLRLPQARGALEWASSTRRGASWSAARAAAVTRSADSARQTAHSASPPWKGDSRPGAGLGAPAHPRESRCSSRQRRQAQLRSPSRSIWALELAAAVVFCRLSCCRRMQVRVADSSVGEAVAIRSWPSLKIADHRKASAPGCAAGPRRCDPHCPCRSRQWRSYLAPVDP